MADRSCDRVIMRWRRSGRAAFGITMQDAAALVPLEKIAGCRLARAVACAPCSSRVRLRRPGWRRFFDARKATAKPSGPETRQSEPQPPPPARRAGRWGALAPNGAPPRLAPTPTDGVTGRSRHRLGPVAIGATPEGAWATPASALCGPWHFKHKSLSRKLFPNPCRHAQKIRCFLKTVLTFAPFPAEVATIGFAGGVVAATTSSAGATAARLLCPGAAAVAMATRDGRNEAQRRRCTA